MDSLLPEEKRAIEKSKRCGSCGHLELFHDRFDDRHCRVREVEGEACDCAYGKMPCDKCGSHWECHPGCINHIERVENGKPQEIYYGRRPGTPVYYSTLAWPPPPMSTL